MSGSAPPGSLAFNNPSAAKVDQQRKILAELERQKKLLDAEAAAKNSPTNNSGGGGGVKGGGDKSAVGGGNSLSSAPPTAPPNAVAPTSPSTSILLDPAASQLLPSNQRAALEQAAKTSFGYFIAQDSSFGNTILPVIPRFPNNSSGNSSSNSGSANNSSANANSKL